MKRYVGVTSTPIDLKNVVVTISDENGSNSVEIKFGEGNLTWTRATTNEYRLDKGNIDTVVAGDDVPMDVSFSGNWDYFKGQGSAITLSDALHGENSASGWVSAAASVAGQECSPYCVNIGLANTPACSTGITNPIETMVFPYFRSDSDAYDVSAGTISVSGKCNATKPTSVRSA